MTRALATVLVVCIQLVGLLFCFVSLAGLFVVTVLVAPLLMFMDWRDKRRGIYFRPEIMR